MHDKDELPYRKADELPTILWVFGIMSISLICLLSANIFSITDFARNILVMTGIIFGSIGLSIFLVAVIYPLTMDLLFEKKNKKDKPSNNDEIL